MSLILLNETSPLFPLAIDPAVCKVQFTHSQGSCSASFQTQLATWVEFKAVMSVVMQGQGSHCWWRCNTVQINGITVLMQNDGNIVDNDKKLLYNTTYKTQWPHTSFFFWGISGNCWQHHRPRRHFQICVDVHLRQVWTALFLKWKELSL